MSIMTTQNRTYVSYFAGIAIMTLTLACAKKPTASTEAAGTGTTSGKHIYVSSGSVNAGLGVTVSTASKTVAKYELDGTYVGLVKDYSSSSSDSPASIIDYDSTRLIALIENTAGRRVEYITKDTGGVSSIFSNITNLNGVVRSFYIDYSGQFLISKTTGIEKMQFAGNQTPGPSGGTFISNPASCGTLGTAVVDITKAPAGSDFVIMSHGAASPNNKVAIVKKTGYGVAGDCLSATTVAPTVNHLPTAVLMHSSGVLFVAYSNATGPVHQIYAFNPTFTSTTASIGAWPATPAYNDLSTVLGVSRMMEMPDGSILVASAASTMNTIERFTYSSSTGLLTRVGTTPFIGPTIFSRAVSGMVIGD